MSGGRPSGGRLSVRARLLVAADELLFVEGNPAVSVDEVLRRAAASPPSLYTHFGSKAGLLAAALRRRMGEWLGIWDDALAAATTPQERALAVFDALRRYEQVHPEERWCAFTASAITAPWSTPVLREVLEAEEGALTERVASAAAEVVGAGPERDLLAAGLLVAYHGTLAYMLQVPHEEAIDRGEAVARMLVEQVTA